MQQIAKEKFQIIGIRADDADGITRPHVSYLTDAWRRFKENKVALVALAVLLALILLCIFVPIFSPYSFEALDKTAINQRPSGTHWFGTDKLGRDMFTRVWTGGRVSMVIGFTGAIVSAVIGCIYGGISAYFGGRVDTIMMRIVEVLVSVPYLIVVILMSVVLDSKSLGTLLLAMCITGWCGTARFVRAQMLKIKSEEYVLAAKCLGVSPWKTVVRHFIPNTAEDIANIAATTFQEALRSFKDLPILPEMTRENVLENVVLQALSRKRNRQLLKSHPHITLLGPGRCFPRPGGAV